MNMDPSDLANRNRVLEQYKNIIGQKVYTVYNESSVILIDKSCYKKVFVC